MLAANALTTLERMKLMLGLDDSADESTNMIVELLINRASSWVEQQLGRHLRRDTYRQWYPADGQQELVTKEDPRRYDYGQTANIGVIYRDDGWLKAGYHGGLSYDQLATKRVIEVSYTAGYVLPKDATPEDPQTLPADLEGLIWDIVQQTYANMQNGSQGLKSFSISDVRWDFDKSVQPSWLQVINLYRRY